MMMMRIAFWTCGLLAMLYVALVSPEKGGLGGDMAHGIAFFLFGLATPLVWQRRSLWAIWLGLILLAGAIELGQDALVAAELSAHRAGSWADWRIGAIATSAGIAAIAALRALAWLVKRGYAWIAADRAGVASTARR